MIVQIGEMKLDCELLKPIINGFKNDIAKSIKNDYYNGYLEDGDYDSFEMYLMDVLGSDEVWAMSFLNCYCMHNYNKSWDDIYDEHKNELFMDEVVINALYCELNDIMPDIINIDNYVNN